MLTGLLLLACTGDDSADDSAAPPLDGCVASEDRSVELGVLGGQLFTPLTPGQEVRLVAAPQGGQGVEVAAQTLGLYAGSDSVVDVLLEPWWNGVVQGSFVSEGLTLYCTENDDGSTQGRVWGTVVGFDPDIYQTDNDLAVLDGETIDMLVGVTDAGGNYAEGHVEVVIEF